MRIQLLPYVLGSMVYEGLILFGVKTTFVNHKPTKEVTNFYTKEQNLFSDNPYIYHRSIGRYRVIQIDDEGFILEREKREYA